MSEKCPDCKSNGTFKESEAVGFKECEECGFWEDKSEPSKKEVPILEYWGDW